MPRSLQSLVKAIDSLPDPTFVIDGTGAVVGWNAAIEELSHVDRENILGKSDQIYSEPFFGKRSPDLIDLLHGESEEVRKKYANVIVQKGQVSGETYATHARGGRGSWLWAKASFVYETGIEQPVGALQCFRDISHHKSLETKLRMAEAISKDTADFFDNVVQGANVWISFTDSQGAVLLWNDCAERLSGYAAGEVIGQDGRRLIYPDEEYRKEIDEDLRTSLESNGTVRNFYTTITSREGKKRILSWNITRLSDGTEGDLGYLEVGMDMTEVHEAHEKVNLALEEARENAFRFRTIFETAADLIMIVGTSGAVQKCNSRITSLLGYSAEELEGESIEKLVFPDDISAVWRLLEYTYRLGSRYNEEYRFVNAKQEVVDVEICSAVLKGKDSDSVLMLIRDVTERKKAQEQLKYLSLHDPMTGLYNRRYFEEELRRLDVRRHGPISIISCDIDGLKLVNDTLGHRKGDELIKAAATVIKAPFRSSDVVARIGGDEFTVILPKTNAQVAQKARNRILVAIDSFNANNPDLPLSISVGVATSSSETSMEKLFHESDDAMYEHKANRGQRSREVIIKTLMLALGEKDFVSRGHVERVKDLAIRFGETLALTPAELDDLGLLAQIHDIGNIGLPESILSKRDFLTEEEQKEIRKHSELGYRIAMSTPELARIADGLMQHHEWWNGQGYPKGLKGENILLAARIFAIVDAYDAMTSYRPYREMLTPEEAMQELRNGAGIQFDPKLVVIFENMMASLGAI